MPIFDLEYSLLYKGTFSAAVESADEARAAVHDHAMQLLAYFPADAVVELGVPTERKESEELEAGS